MQLQTFDGTLKAGTKVVIPPRFRCQLRQQPPPQVGEIVEWRQNSQSEWRPARVTRLEKLLSLSLLDEDDDDDFEPRSASARLQTRETAGTTSPRGVAPCCRRRRRSPARPCWSRWRTRWRARRRRASPGGRRPRCGEAGGRRGGERVHAWSTATRLRGALRDGAGGLGVASGRGHGPQRVPPVPGSRARTEAHYARSAARRAAAARHADDFASLHVGMAVDVWRFDGWQRADHRRGRAEARPQSRGLHHGGAHDGRRSC